MSFTRRISGTLPKPVVWRRPIGGRGTWTLHSADDLVATIRHRGWVRPVAIAECASGRWEFELKGWFRTHYVIRSCDTDEDLAIFRPRSIRRGGDVELPNGTRYEGRTRFGSFDLEFRRREGMPAFLSFRSRFLRTKTDVEIAPTGASVPELPMLVCLGAYLLLNSESPVRIAMV